MRALGFAFSILFRVGVFALVAEVCEAQVPPISNGQVVPAREQYVPLVSFPFEEQGIGDLTILFRDQARHSLPMNSSDWMKSRPGELPFLVFYGKGTTKAPAATSSGLFSPPGDGIIQRIRAYYFQLKTNNDFVFQFDIALHGVIYTFDLFYKDGTLCQVGWHLESVPIDAIKNPRRTRLAQNGGWEINHNYFKRNPPTFLMEGAQVSPAPEEESLLALWSRLYRASIRGQGEFPSHLNGGRFASDTGRDLFRALKWLYPRMLRGERRNLRRQIENARERALQLLRAQAASLHLSSLFPRHESARSLLEIILSTAPDSLRLPAVELTIRPRGGGSGSVGQVTNFIHLPTGRCHATLAELVRTHGQTPRPEN